MPSLDLNKVPHHLKGGQARKHKGKVKAHENMIKFFNKKLWEEKYKNGKT